MNQYSKICVEFWSDRAQSHFITKYSPDSQFHFECFIRDYRRLRVDVKVKTCLPNSTKCIVPLYIVIYIQIHCSPAESYFILYTLYWIGFLACGGRLWMFGLIEYKSIKIFVSSSASNSSALCATYIFLSQFLKWIPVLRMHAPSAMPWKASLKNLKNKQTFHLLEHFLASHSLQDNEKI